jgi:hypothetical protein
MMLPWEEIRKGLGIFDKILDVGIITETNTGFFMGYGYAVLNIYQPGNTSDNQKYQELSVKLM